MRKASLCLIPLLFSLQSHAQFPIHILLPIGVDGISFGDTMLNTTTILSREKIKKVIADQTTVQGKSKIYHHSEYNIANGLIKSNRFCFRRLSDTEFCYIDTFIYDSNERLLEFRELNLAGTIFFQQNLSYISEDKVSHTWIFKNAGMAIADTDIYIYHYNQIGQLIRKEKGPTRFKANDVTLFYNADGLIDSIHHHDPAIGDYLFKRIQKGSIKDISLNTRTGSYRWAYNSAGQCMSSEWKAKSPTNLKNKSNEGLFRKASYSYNPNGTLSKIVEKASKKRVTTTIYSYEK